MYSSPRKGFTLIEVLVALGIMMILLGVSAMGFSSFRDYFLLRITVQDVQTAILNARSATLASGGDSVHGVHIEATKLVSFSGDTYTVGSPSNVELVFPGTVTASSTSGIGSDVIFMRLTGRTQASGTITLTEARSGASTTLGVTNAGILEIY